MTAPRVLSDPQPGFFAVRMVKGGPRVAARIVRSVATDPMTGETLDRSPVTWAEIAGKPVEVDRVWMFGEVIDEAEYRRLTAVAEWARYFSPDDPAAAPDQRIDHLSTPIPF